MATRILVADDHLAVREGVRALLELEDDFQVVGEAADGQEAARKALELKPDLIVLDNSMPGMTGLEVSRQIAGQLPDTAIVFLTLESGIRDLALASGAVGFLSKDAPADEFLRVVRAAADALRVRRRLQDVPGSWRRVADLLIGQRSITPEQLDEIVLSRQGDEAIATTILRSGVIDETELGHALSRASNRPLVSLAPFPEIADPIDPRESRLAARRLVDPIDASAVRRLPRRFSETKGCVLVTCVPNDCLLAMVDPLDEDTIREAQELLGERAVTVVTATATDVREAIARAYDPSLLPTQVVSTGTGTVIPSLVAMGGTVLVVAIVFFWFFHTAVRFETAFSLFALACGLFFFAYALKYYITTATVLVLAIFGDKLTFARNTGNGGGNGNEHPNGLRTNGHGNGGGHAKKLNGQPITNGRPHTNGYKTLRGEKIDTEGTVIADPWAPMRDNTEWRLPQEKQPFVSVHVATYNERQVMDRLLTACTSFDYDNYEVLICDDSTDAAALRILERWRQHPRVRILHRATRKGFKGGALHEGLRRMHPKTEYVVIFDADFVPPADIIWHFLEYFGRVTTNANGDRNGTNGNGNGNRYLPAAGGANGNGNGHAGERGNGHPNGNGNGNGHPKYVNGVPMNGERIAAVQGYQWHMLNAGENWVTRGVRAEFAGSYVLERSGQELFGMMKMISGSVYMIRADVLRKLGWSTSITEDWELTIRLYLAGYKVLYTPYIQAPAECVSTIGRLVKQRMRWAEGHTFNVKKYFWPIMRSPNLTFREKLEWIYYAPYYLQSVVFALGTVAWLGAEILFAQHIPNWSAVLGWSLVFTNVLALPLMNLAGITLEGSIKRDVGGILSFVGLSTLLVPFQAYAALKGLFETEEGGWVRTPKSGVVTEAFGQFKLARLLPWELPKKRRQRKRALPARIAVTSVLVLVAAGILAVGALSMRAAAASGAVTVAELAVIPGFLGTIAPLLLVAYAWFKLKRVGLIAFALFFGISANLVFLANSIPADALANNTSTFTFASSTTFNPPNLDMKQGYTPPVGNGVTCGAGASWTCTYASDTFSLGQTMAAGSTTANLYLTNTAVAQVVFRASASANQNKKNLTVTKPTGTVQNDLLVAAITYGGVTAPSTVPAGWTLQNTVNNTSVSLAVYTKVAGGAEPASYVWGWSSFTNTAGTISAYIGADTTAPIGPKGTATTLTAPAVTTTRNNSVVVTSYALDCAGTITTPATMTARGDTANGVTGSLDDKSIATAGSTGPFTAAAVGCTPAQTASQTLTVQPPTSLSCDLTLNLRLLSGVTSTTIGSGTASIANTGTTTLVTSSFANSAVTFAAGDQLLFDVIQPTSAGCAVTLRYDGQNNPSRITVATIVPEGALGLLLIAPLIPLGIAWRRRRARAE